MEIVLQLVPWVFSGAGIGVSGLFCGGGAIQNRAANPWIAGKPVYGQAVTDFQAFEYGNIDLSIQADPAAGQVAEVIFFTGTGRRELPQVCDRCFAMNSVLLKVGRLAAAVPGVPEIVKRNDEEEREKIEDEK